MRKIWVVSDTHFHHKNIVDYGQRPFNDVKEMDEALVDNWNSTVNKGDIVYHLGDVLFGKDCSILGKLNGAKRLIVGNHDDLKNQNLLGSFQKVMLWRMFPDWKVVLTHVPLLLDSDENKKYTRNIHGHVHQNSLGDKRYTNVSVEAIGYKPVLLTDLIKES